MDCIKLHTINSKVSIEVKLLKLTKVLFMLKSGLHKLHYTTLKEAQHLRQNYNKLLNRLFLCNFKYKKTYIHLTKKFTLQKTLNDNFQIFFNM